MDLPSSTKCSGELQLARVSVVSYFHIFLCFCLFKNIYCSKQNIPLDNAMNFSLALFLLILVVLDYLSSRIWKNNNQLSFASKGNRKKEQGMLEKWKVVSVSVRNTQGSTDGF